MRKYEVLSDEEIKKNISSWEGLRSNAAVRNEERKVACCDHTIAELKRERDSRKQSA